MVAIGNILSIRHHLRDMHSQNVQDRYIHRNKWQQSNTNMALTLKKHIVLFISWQW